MEGHKIKHSPLIDERSPGADINRHDKHKGGDNRNNTIQSIEQTKNAG